MHPPSLLTSAPPGTPRGLVLMLHGGADKGLDPIDERSLSWRRSRSMMRDLEPEWHGAGLGVALLRYGVKGWNRHLESPVTDARWAIDEVRREYGDVPVVLLGHSMGGRCAAAVADAHSVVGVVALAPWFPKGEPVEPLEGKHLATAHGRKDRITRFKDTEWFVRRAKEVAASATLDEIVGGGHYMLRRRSAWNRFALERTLNLLA